MIDLERLPWGKAIPYTSPTGKETVLYGIGMLAEALGRKPQTIRKWEISGIIPSRSAAKKDPVVALRTE